MAAIRFNLDKGNILLIYHHGPHDKVKLSIKEKCSPKDWDAKRNRMRDGRPRSNYVNSLLNKIIDYIDTVRLQYKIEGKMLKANTLKELVRVRIFGDSSKLGIYEYANLWINEKSISVGTKKTLINAIAVIRRLYPNLTYNDITLSWLKDFKNKTIHLSPNYTSNCIKKLRELLDSAMVDGHHNNTIHLNKKFTIKTVDTNKIALHQDWLDKVFENLHTFEPRHSNAAILFLIGCMTGQRWQDYSLINKSMIFYKGDDAYISLVQPKTTIRVTIPVSNKLISLLDMECHKVSQQKFNQYIKEVFKIIEYPEYQKIASHTARRTFATLAVMAGVDISLIMRITGHKSEKTFRLYVKMDDILAAMQSSAAIKAYQDKKA